MAEIRYTHTNLVAGDWKALAAFYIDVFGCTPVPPERDLAGSWIDRLTGIDGARITGTHLLLPGFGPGGPTLEIFQYEPDHKPGDPDPINRHGFAHIAFHVDDVRQLVDRIIEGGGCLLGELVDRQYEDGRVLTVAYCRDPEGNCLEIQNWS